MMPMRIIDAWKTLTGRAQAVPVHRTPTGVVPPARVDQSSVAGREAVSLAAVYRAVSIISNTVASMPYYVEKDGTRLEDAKTPSVIKAPSLEYSRGDFVEALTTSLALTGNAYFLSEGEYRGAPAQLTPLDPQQVAVSYDPEKRRALYHVGTHTYTRDKIGHCRLFTMPGSITGLGPIQAAATDIRGAINTRDYASKYFDATGQPSGIITTDQDMTRDEARDIIAAYNNRDPETGEELTRAYNPARVKALPKGMKYQPLSVAPREAQWIEARQFDTTSIARLFGVPASLLLAAVEGNSQTYANVEQEWISFARFTLTQYTRTIEDELTRMTVRGQRVKFNYSGLLRSDTLTRYQAYQIALACGFQTVNEVRALEDLPPLTQPTQPVESTTND